MQFTLTIELGNDAMQKAEHIEEVLRKLGQRLPYISTPPEDGDEGAIRDSNGNKVGTWQIVASHASEGADVPLVCVDCGRPAADNPHTGTRLGLDEYGRCYRAGCSDD